MPVASFTLTATALPDIMKFELAQSFIFLLHQSATTATSSRELLSWSQSSIRALIISER